MVWLRKGIWKQRMSAIAFRTNAAPSALLVALLTTSPALVGCSDGGNDAAQANAAQYGAHADGRRDTVGSAREVYDALVEDDRATVTIETSSPGEIVAPQDAGLGYVDPQTGKIAWRALVCRNPDCADAAGTAKPFTIAVPGARVGEDGQLLLPPADKIEAYARSHLRCPTCGRFEELEQYEPPNVTTRRAQLNAELKAARQARAGGDSHGNHRTPAEIMYELSTLPKLYLLPE